MRNKLTNVNSKTNQCSLLAVKYRLFTVVVYLLLAGGGGNSEAKVIRSKRSSCSEGAGQQQKLVHSTLPLPPPLIKNECWAVWVKDRNGFSVRGIQRGSVTELLDTPQTAVDSPEVAIKSAIKAVEHSLK